MAVPRIRVSRGRAQLSRETHDRAAEMFAACYAEAGFPTSSRWTSAGYVLDERIPETVRHRAAKLVCDALDIPYEIIGEVEDVPLAERHGHLRDRWRPA